MIMSNYSTLRDEAVKVQQGQYYDKDSEKWKKITTEAEIQTATVDYFLKAGLDYKGQLQCCYVTKGGGGELDVAIDPGRIFFGVCSTQVTASGGVTRSKEIFLIAQRGPSDVEFSDGIIRKIPSPIMVNCLAGAMWEGSVKAGIEISVGIKYSASVFSLDTTDGVKGSPKSKVTKSYDTDDSVSPAFSVESFAVGFEAEAKAGFAANAGYNYDHYYAEDLSPIPCPELSQAEAIGPELSKVKAILGELFNGGSYKAVVKRHACEFANQHRSVFKPIRYEGRLWGHVSSKDICDILSKGCKKNGVSKEIVQKAESYIESLRCWANKEMAPSIPTCLRISTHKADGKAGLIASAKVSVNAFGVISGEAGVSGEACTVSGEYKLANIRYQTVYPALRRRGEKFHIIMTQDSKIVYKQILFTPISIKAKANGSVAFHAKSTDDNKTVEENTEFKVEKKLLNRMSYTTTSVFWYSGSKIYNKQKTGSKDSQRFRGQTLVGTGLSFGESFELENLVQFYIDYDLNDRLFYSKAVENYFVRVANSLSVKLDDLIKFFESREIYTLLRDLTTNSEGNRINSGVETVLLESSFRVSGQLDVVSTVQGEKELIELEANMAKKLSDISLNQRTLEAIRIRYRIQDLTNDDSAFKLGFKVFGTGVGINLKKIDRAGSEGIVDLATIWMDSSLSEGGSAAYEKAVPQVALFCQ